MQQPKIEVRARDERRRDEACAKWSTVERERGMREGKRDRERGYEVLWEKKKKKKPDGKQNKGKAQEKWRREEDERRRARQLRGYVCNEDLSKCEDQQRRGKSVLLQNEITGMDANTGGKVKGNISLARGTDVLLILNICPRTPQRKSCGTAGSDGLGRVRLRSAGTD